jgi:hypothetical protein
VKNEKPLFYTFKDFTPDSRPLFLLQNTNTGEYMVTDNPCEISFDPTDGGTRYVDLLGWAVLKALAVDSCRYQSLREAVVSTDWQPHLAQETAN